MLTTREKISRACIQIQKKNTFFAYLSLYLKFKEVKKGEMLMDSMAVDKEGNCYYVKEFVDKLKDAELQSGIIHEILHIALFHLLRCGDKNPIAWNFATDLCVNGILKNNNFQLSKDWLIPDYEDKFKFGQTKVIKNCSKKVAEQIYDELPKIKMKGVIYVIGDGKDKGKELGKAFDVHIEGKGKDGKELTSKEKRELEKKWMDRVFEAITISKMKGDIPAGLERLIGKLHEEKINWKALLNRFIVNQIPYDYTWQRYSKRSIATQVYMPNILKEQIDICICCDVSGSIGNTELQDFLSEVIGMARAYQERIKMRILTHEVKINDDYEISNGNIEKIKELKIHGGGGTSHIQPFNFIRENIRDCKAVVFLTDGFSDLEGIPFEEYPFEKIFVISKGGDDSQLKGKRCHIIHLKD